MERQGLLRVGVLVGALAATAFTLCGADSQTTGVQAAGAVPARDSATEHAKELVDQGRQIFRFDTFGDEAFWGGALQLHRAIEGRNWAASVRASARRRHSGWG